MPSSALRERLGSELLAFAWDEWAQMGVLATPRHRSPWVQDPEALIVFTLEIARRDARLFDELLDWMLVNEPLVSSWRLRSMCTVPGDADLAAAAQAWVAHHGGRKRPQPPSVPRHTNPESLFRELGIQIPEPDEAFAEHGFLRPVASPSGKTQQPDLLAPINLGFRLRHLLGVSARAEVVRCLMTIDAPRVSTSVLARAAGYSTRNVQEALVSLHSARTILRVDIGSDQRYALDSRRWSSFLEIDDDVRAHRDWPQLLGGLRRILRWLWRNDIDSMSEYMRLSSVRDLLEEVHDDLAYAGVRVEYGRTVADDWEALELTVEQALAALRPLDVAWAAADDQRAVRRAASLEVTEEVSGAYRWRLRAANGQIVAVSSEMYASRHTAADAGRFVATRGPELTFEAEADEAGAVRWSARAAHGGSIARSSEAFASRSNALRAAGSAQRAFSDAGQAVRAVSAELEDKSARATGWGSGPGSTRPRRSRTERDLGSADGYRGGETMKFVIYTDSGGKYRWRLVAGNGQTIASSGESFDSRPNARRAAENVKSNAGSAAVEDG